MPTISNPGTLEQLLQRLRRLTPDSERRWGTMTPGEMLCHLGDASDGVLGRRKPPGIENRKVLPLPVVWVLLYTPLPFPKGVETRSGVNPKKEGTRPGNFEQDRARVLSGLQGLAVAPAEALPQTHFRFGKMSLRAWHHWAFKHVDHHLRQFGL